MTIDTNQIEDIIKQNISGKYTTYELRKAGISGHTVDKITAGNLNIDYLSWKTVKKLIELHK